MEVSHFPHPFLNTPQPHFVHEKETSKLEKVRFELNVTSQKFHVGDSMRQLHRGRRSHFQQHGGDGDLPAQRLHRRSRLALRPQEIQRS
jgi:hypothetical protein